MYYYKNRWPAIEGKKVSVQTVKVEKRPATTMTTSSTSTPTTKTTNPQIQTENKTTIENLSKTPPGKTNINEKEKREGCSQSKLCRKHQRK